MKYSNRRRFTPTVSGLESRDLLTVFEPVKSVAPIIVPPTVGLPGSVPKIKSPVSGSIPLGTYKNPVIPPPTWITK